MKIHVPRLSSAFASLALLFLGATTVTSAQADDAKCFQLLDNQSPLAASLANLKFLEPRLDLDVVSQAFTSVSSAVPGFSQCAANVDVTSIVTTVLASKKANECRKALSVVPLPKKEFTDSAFTEFFCPYYRDAFAPCVNDVLINEVILPAMNSAGGCCNGLKNTIVKSFGSDLATSVDSLLKLMGNALCSVKTFTSEKLGEGVDQTCGFSLASAFLNESSSDDENAIKPFLNALQIPTSQVCSAVAGQELRLATGETVKFKPGKAQASYGVCFQPMSDLVDHVSKYPIVQQLRITGPKGATVAISDLYAEGKCVRGDDLIYGLLAPDSFFVKAWSAYDLVAPAITHLDSILYEPPSSGSDESTLTGLRYLSFEKSLSSSSSDSSFIGDSSYEVDDESNGSDLSLDSSVSENNSTATFQPAVPAPGFDSLSVADVVVLLLGPVDQMCFHMPHGVSCDYGDETISYAYPEFGSQLVPTTEPQATASMATTGRLRR
uniref:Uncharacterized protein n=1 Tax=Globisporangium ultimum (strain ATCC 200006 / CBS 805.95 / DAOM BR144) TaxID=431595 RepID=K3WF54_GLOUD